MVPVAKTKGILARPTTPSTTSEPIEYKVLIAPRPSAPPNFSLVSAICFALSAVSSGVTSSG